VDLTRTRIDANPTVEVRPTPSQQVGFKPDGFWYSVDRDWERWCDGDEPEWLKGKYTHEVTLGSENLLFIRTSDELRAFHREYQSESPLCWINWPAVAQRYDGIEIAPYLWECRLHPEVGWYYTWDCASGCIWTPKGVVVSSAKL
jgi:hypothetical protein